MTAPSLNKSDLTEKNMSEEKYCVSTECVCGQILGQFQLSECANHFHFHWPLSLLLFDNPNDSPQSQTKASNVCVWNIVGRTWMKSNDPDPDT